jgi:hypothetical protein
MACEICVENKESIEKSPNEVDRAKESSSKIEASKEMLACMEGKGEERMGKEGREEGSTSLLPWHLGVRVVAEKRGF